MSLGQRSHSNGDVMNSPSKEQLKECSSDMLEHTLKSWKRIKEKAKADLLNASKAVREIEREIESRGKKYRINHRLAEVQGLSAVDIARIEDIGEHLMDVLSNPSDHGLPQTIPKLVESLETRLQGLWGFTQDPKYHRYGHHISGCTCPKMDNDELVGHTTMRYVNANCPFHAGI